MTSFLSLFFVLLLLFVCLFVIFLFVFIGLFHHLFFPKALRKNMLNSENKPWACFWPERPFLVALLLEEVLRFKNGSAQIWNGFFTWKRTILHLKMLRQKECGYRRLDFCVLAARHKLNVWNRLKLEELNFLANTICMLPRNTSTV